MPSSPSTQVSLQQIGSDRKRLFLVFIIAVVLIVSWTGLIDKLSADFLNDSFVNAVMTYAGARTINGLISTIGTTTVSIGVASITPGQLLDPVNDAVERLSEVMTIAIGSIVLQKTLLAITSSIVFKVFLTLSGIALFVSSCIKEAPYIQVLSKLFVFLVFIRLSLGFMLLLNLAVDQSYLSEKIELSQKEIETLASDLDEMNAGQKGVLEEKNKLKNDLKELTIQRGTLSTELTLLLKEEEELSKFAKTKEVELDQVESKLDFVDQYNPLFSNKTLNEIKTSLSETESSLDSKRDQIEELQEKLEEIGEEITHKDNTISGKPNGIIDRVSNTLSGITSTFENLDISELTEYLGNKISSILDTMILFAMKTVIFPVLFMYLLTKGFKLIWGIDARTLIKREYKTLKSE